MTHKLWQTKVVAFLDQFIIQRSGSKGELHGKH